MKSLLSKNVAVFINVLSQQFHTDLKINEERIESLIKKLNKPNDGIGFIDTEKAISCIYMLQMYGIPLKKSSEALGFDSKKTFIIFKHLGTPTYAYIGQFITYVTRGDNLAYQRKFKELFSKLQPKVSDQFILVVSLNIFLKKEVHQYPDFREQDNRFGFSDVAIYDYKQKIRDELNGNVF